MFYLIGKAWYLTKKLIDMKSLDIVPEKYFLMLVNFYSYLRDKCITKSDYKTGKYLWINLKLRNLNNLYKNEKFE